MCVHVCVRACAEWVGVGTHGFPCIIVDEQLALGWSRSACSSIFFWILVAQLEVVRLHAKLLLGFILMLKANLPAQLCLYLRLCACLKERVLLLMSFPRACKQHKCTASLP